MSPRKLEVFIYFLFLENWGHVTDGRRDGQGATHNAAP